MDVASEILDAVEIMMDQKIRESTAQIYLGVCKSINGNTCVMFVNGRDNTVQFYGLAPTVGTIYRVFVPNDNMSMAFIITGAKLGASDVGAVNKAGDTMTGNLTVGSASMQTNGYVTGTWLRTTANTALNKTPTKIAVLEDGWVYSRTPEQIKSDIGLSNVDNVKQYSEANPPPYPVTSVNGKTGDVTLKKADVGLSRVANVKQYSASNPPPYPVTSVNGKTGDVTIDEYKLPVASKSTLGGIKVGSGLAVNQEGVLSVTGGVADAISIITSSTVPTSQKPGDYWYEVVS